jgi:hypothetical protein
MSFLRRWLWRMPYSWTWRRVTLVRTDASVEYTAFIIRVTTIGQLGTTLAVTSNRRTLRRNAVCNIVFLRSVLRLLVTANVVPSSPILLTLIWWKRYIPRKRRFLQEPRTVMTQKTSFFVFCLLFKRNSFDEHGKCILKLNLTVALNRDREKKWNTKYF